MKFVLTLAVRLTALILKMQNVKEKYANLS